MLGGQDFEAPIAGSNDCGSEKEDLSNEVFEGGFEVAGDDEADSLDPPKEVGESGHWQPYWEYGAWLSKLYWVRTLFSPTPNDAAS